MRAIHECAHKLSIIIQSLKFLKLTKYVSKYPCEDGKALGIIWQRFYRNQDPKGRQDLANIITWTPQEHHPCKLLATLTGCTWAAHELHMSYTQAAHAHELHMSCIWATHTRAAHKLHTSCTQAAHKLHMSCTWAAHELHTNCTCTWAVHELPMSCAWTAHGLHTSCTRVEHELHTGCTGAAHELHMHMSHTRAEHELYMSCTRATHGLHMNCTWAAHELHTVKPVNIIAQTGKELVSPHP